MKFLFVATFLVFSIGSETAAKLLLEETRATPLQLMLNLHFFYDRDFVSIAGANEGNAKKKIEDITDHTKNFFKLSSFPSEIMIKVVGTTLWGFENVGRRSLSQKFQNFTNVLRNGNYPQTTHLFLLLTSNSEGRDKLTRMKVSEGSRVCSQLNEEKALIFEYWDGETDQQTAMALTQSIGHALYLQYDDNHRKDDQGGDCEGSLMTRRNPQPVWSSCSSADFTKQFTSPVGLPCLKSPEYTLTIHAIYDELFMSRLGRWQSNILINNAKKAFKLNSMTPKINLKFGGYTRLHNKYVVSKDEKIFGEGKSFQEFKDLIQADPRYSDSIDLFILFSAFERDTDMATDSVEPLGHVCSRAKSDRAAMIKHHNRFRFNVDFTSLELIKVITKALGILKDNHGSRRPGGHYCPYGYLGLSKPIHQQDADRWAHCSVEDLAGYIRQLKSGCGFCLKKTFDWSADGY